LLGALYQRNVPERKGVTNRSATHTESPAVTRQRQPRCQGPGEGTESKKARPPRPGRVMCECGRVCTPSTPSVAAQDTTCPRRQSIGAYQWTIGVSHSAQGTTNSCAWSSALKHTLREMSHSMSARITDRKQDVSPCYSKSRVQSMTDTSRIPIPHISRSFTRPTERRLKTPSWLDSHCNLRRSRPRPIHSPRPTQPSAARHTTCTLLFVHAFAVTG
jgi:hypothetical protein